MSRPREKRETGKQDLFRSRLDQIINMKHELVRLAQAIDWPVLEERFGAVYSDGPGMPPLPTRLMAGLAILKHTFNLSDEVLCARWVENPYFQYLVCDVSAPLIFLLQRSGGALAAGPMSTLGNPGRAHCDALIRCA
ncbi:hypothetical protein MesoLj113b_64740 [Mesorhizobium sp. 113-3-3]|nr:hypothetical protein MesoLj113b_64740 [Mesorhizobium sp. 113-3-3]BCG90809.1 hypothetical protein MesoLj113c_69190 [Mesorhizobium sp. 113-3-9]